MTYERQCLSRWPSGHSQRGQPHLLSQRQFRWHLQHCPIHIRYPFHNLLRRRRLLPSSILITSPSLFERRPAELSRRRLLQCHFYPSSLNTLALLRSVMSLLLHLPRIRSLLSSAPLAYCLQLQHLLSVYVARVQPWILELRPHHPMCNTATQMQL